MEKTDHPGSQWARTMLEAMSCWSDTQTQVLRYMLDCSAGTAKENLHLFTELQTAALEAAQQGQSYVFQHLSALPEVPHSPQEYYQKSLRACAETAEKMYKLHLGNAQVVLRSVEQVNILAQQTRDRVQESYKAFADKLQGLCASV